MTSEELAAIRAENDREPIQEIALLLAEVDRLRPFEDACVSEFRTAVKEKVEVARDALQARDAEIARLRAALEAAKIPWRFRTLRDYEIPEEFDDHNAAIDRALRGEA